MMATKSKRNWTDREVYMLAWLFATMGFLILFPIVAGYAIIYKLENLHREQMGANYDQRRR